MGGYVSGEQSEVSLFVCCVVRSAPPRRSCCRCRGALATQRFCVVGVFVTKLLHSAALNLIQRFMCAAAGRARAPVSKTSVEGASRLWLCAPHTLVCSAPGVHSCVCWGAKRNLAGKQKAREAGSSLSKGGQSAKLKRQQSERRKKGEQWQQQQLREATKRKRKSLLYSNWLF